LIDFYRKTVKRVTQKGSRVGLCCASLDASKAFAKVVLHNGIFWNCQRGAPVVFGYVFWKYGTVDCTAP